MLTKGELLIIIVAGIIAMSLSGCSTLPKNWSRGDSNRQIAYTTMHIADWRTTMDIARHPGYFETNSILGMHPSNATINSYFLTTGIIQLAISAALPPPQRKVWQWSSFLFELKFVIQNLKLGLAIL